SCAPRHHLSGPLADSGCVVDGKDMTEPSGMSRKNRAFTLIELMVVIAIIAILAAILIPNFMHARAQAQTTGCVANEKQVATAVEEYAVDHNGSYGGGGSVTSTLLGAAYLGVTPKDPVNGSQYSLNTAA